MAHDALSAYARDVASGKDALLVCDTKEVCDALNQRIHHARVDADTPTVTAARGQRIAVGDLIISRRNDPNITIWEATQNIPATDPVRNGNRWHVEAIDTERRRIAARRLGDGARGAFDGDYLREHITHGYAVTVHAAQASPLTHPRRLERNGHPRTAVRGDDPWPRVQQRLPVRAPRRGVPIQRCRPRRAARAAPRQQSRRRQLFRHIIATDLRAQTAHDLAAETGCERLPMRVAALLIDRRTHTVQTRRADYRHWCSNARERSAGQEHSTDQHLHQSVDYSLEL
jgi:hypothetical protein